MDTNIFATALDYGNASRYNASIKSKREHPPGEFFWGGQKPCPGAKFSCKSTAPGEKKHPPPGSILEDLVSLFC